MRILFLILPLVLFSGCTSFKAGQFTALVVTGDADVKIRMGKALPVDPAASAPVAK